MNGLSALIKDASQSFLSLATMCGHSEKRVICEPGSGPSSDTEFAHTLILDFPASTTIRNICCFSHPVYGNCGKTAPKDMPLHHFILDNMNYRQVVSFLRMYLNFLNVNCYSREAINTKNWSMIPLPVQSLSHVRLFATPWISAHQASLSITNS